jgi:hypothetical protein
MLQPDLSFIQSRYSKSSLRDVELPSTVSSAYQQQHQQNCPICANRIHNSINLQSTYLWNVIPSASSHVDSTLECFLVRAWTERAVAVVYALVCRFMKHVAVCVCPSADSKQKKCLERWLADHKKSAHARMNAHDQAKTLTYMKWAISQCSRGAHRAFCSLGAHHKDFTHFIA